MSEAGRVWNNSGKTIGQGDENAKPGFDVYGEEPLLHAGQLDLSLYCLRDGKYKPCNFYILGNNLRQDLQEWHLGTELHSQKWSKVKALLLN